LLVQDGAGDFRFPHANSFPQGRSYHFRLGAEQFKVNSITTFKCSQQRGQAVNSIRP